MMPIPAEDVRAAIRSRALELGFDAVGFAPAALGVDCASSNSRCEARSQPRALWAEARSVVALGLSYAPATDPMATIRRPARGNISVYARHRD